MRNRPAYLLVNTPEIELWPASLLRARSNHDARTLSRADIVLRRKRDGRFLAADSRDGLMPLVPHLTREPGLDAALDELERADARAAQVVELRFFAGLSLEQVGETLGLCRRTIDRDWRFARAFIKSHLD